ncbi:MAG: response regulator [Hyphomicrobiales bacterium]|nr:response regulator [Alphaproteobacteria bacterium]
MPSPAFASTEPQEDIFRLLVIDDDLIQRTIISKLGSQSGFQVRGASSYAEAVQLLTSARFDCITLDLSLGEHSGALLLRTIVDTGNRVPVIVISGAEQHVLESTVKTAKALDLDSLPLAKPLNLADLRTAFTRKRQSALTRRHLNQLVLHPKQTSAAIAK